MLTVYRAEILHFLDDPANTDQSYEYYVDGGLVVENGLVVECGDAHQILSRLTQAATEYQLVEYPNSLILPGMVDTHVHFPQIAMVASYGEQLLQWLNQYTYPAERQFNDPVYGRSMAEFFLQQMLAAGTTTAMVFGTVHPQSVDAFFQVAQQLKLRMIAGKVWMDQHCPVDLQDTAQSAYADSWALIERWHHQDRLLYAVTPRFAPTCSMPQLQQAGELLRHFPNLYLHTHLAENQQEMALVGELFPQCYDYLNVYEQANLVGPRSLFAHGVHLTADQCQRLAVQHSSVAFCPSSNLFLGSGLFDLNKLQQHGVKVGIASDIGAGTSLSIIKNLSEAYKIQQLRGQTMSPFQGFYLATLGGAKALDLQEHIGNFLPKKEADFVVIDYHRTSLLERRIAVSHTLQEKLFALMMLADERHIHSTYIMGEQSYYGRTK